MIESTETPREEIRIFEGELAQLDFGPNDILVLYTEQRFSDEAYRRVMTLMERQLPGRKVLFFDDGLKLGVLHPTEELVT